jgi:murein DD-endopeptidase MepM/ murein hydrolase activator NlpD
MIRCHPMTGHDPRKCSKWAVRTGGSTGRVGSYGMTRNDGLKMHNGVDWLALPGKPVFAATGGRVKNRPHPYEETGGGGYGKRFYLVSADDSDLETLYAHMSMVFVSIERWVRAGDCVGLVGRSGNMGLDPSSIPDHLHFGVRLNREWIDPLEWLHGKRHIERKD